MLCRIVVAVVVGFALCGQGHQMRGWPRTHPTAARTVTLKNYDALQVRRGGVQGRALNVRPEEHR